MTMSVSKLPANLSVGNKKLRRKDASYLTILFNTKPKNNLAILRYYFII